MKSGRPVVIRDLSNDRRFAAPVAGVRSMLSGITACINPNLTAGESRVGAFGVLTARSWKPRQFSASQVHVVEDRKSTRLNSSHVRISYAVFCLKKKKKQRHYAV